MGVNCHRQIAIVVVELKHDGCRIYYQRHCVSGGNNGSPNCISIDLGNGVPPGLMALVVNIEA